MKSEYTFLPIRRIVAASLAALVLAVAAPAARSGSLDEGAPSAKVVLRDLNLSTEAGIDTLYKRIQRAARMVCDASVWTGDPRGKHHWWRCYSATVADAVAKVNNARLTAMHEEKSGHKRSG